MKLLFQVPAQFQVYISHSPIKCGRESPTNSIAVVTCGRQLILPSVMNKYMTMHACPSNIHALMFSTVFLSY